MLRDRDRRQGVWLVAASLTLLLGGCASFRSEPAPLTERKADLAPLKGDYERAAVLEHYAGLTGESERVAYRNRVAHVWLAAADARYDDFIRELSQQVKGSNFGSNLTVLLMNGVSIVSGGEARRALAMASATVVGGASAFNRDVLQDQTIAAVVNSAEARRTRELTEIRRKLTQTTAAQYSLGDALADIGRLNRAANLNKAVTTLTATAAADLAAAQEEAKQVIAFSLAPADIHAVRARFAAFVRGADAETLARLGTALGAEEGADMSLTRRNIIDAYVRQTEGGAAAVNALTDKLKTATGEEFSL